MKKQRNDNTASFHNDNQSSDSIDSSDERIGSVDSTGESEQSNEQGSMILGSLVCGAVPALIVGFGALCYHTGYQQGGKEARPTIVHGNQYNSKTYHISPSIGSNNSNNSHK
ncbi:hypothetical protein QUB10_07990 [Microcoleus sp. B5-D4]|uniref:hypothetical protein n=1 Tax=Microcoleus sp. B5-D4 TaxID=2818681 RepID=UPI002FD4C50A